MQDEIASHFAADIDQMTLGHRWIVKEFGLKYLPQTAFHIDPQGTSLTIAVLNFEKTDEEKRELN